MTISLRKLRAANIYVCFLLIPAIFLGEAIQTAKPATPEKRKTLVQSTSLPDISSQAIPSATNATMSFEKEAGTPTAKKKKTEISVLAIVIAGAVIAGILLYLKLKKKEMQLFEFVGQWGSSGFGDGQFSHLSGIAVSPQGNVYITDDVGDYVQEFSADGKFLRRWGGLVDPMDIAVDNAGFVYVTEWSMNQIQKFTAEGAFVAKWGKESGDAGLAYPTYIAVSKAGEVYVLDDQLSISWIKKYSSSGVFIKKWGGLGSGNGQFYSINGLAVSATGDLYAADPSNHRIQVFSAEGEFKDQWGVDFSLMDGLAVDGEGNVWVVAWGLDQIHKYSSAGKQKGAWGSNGFGSGAFGTIVGIAVSATGYAYVADQGNCLVQKFRIK